MRSPYPVASQTKINMPSELILGVPFLLCLLCAHLSGWSKGRKRLIFQILTGLFFTIGMLPIVIGLYLFTHMF